MFRRRPLSWPIILAIVMIVSLVALTVGWILLSVWGAQTSPFSAVYWTILSVGSALLLLMVAGVVFYLVLSIKAINLNQRQSNFIDSVTHELKSPIASLKLYLQTLRRHPMEPERQVKFFNDMLEDVERLDTLINHMLSVAHLERGPEEGMQPVDLMELLTRCAHTICGRYRVPAETIRLDLNPACVLARPMDLELIFHNLLDNAVKYAGEPPEVVVTCRTTERDVQVRVADNGKGIPRHQRARAFRRFVRLVPELERDKPGTGLGLYIVRTLVERMRGSVRITNRDARESADGTELCVRLRAHHGSTG